MAVCVSPAWSERWTWRLECLDGAVRCDLCPDASAHVVGEQADRLRVGRTVHTEGLWQRLLPDTAARQTVSREHFEITGTGLGQRAVEGRVACELRNLSSGGTFLNGDLVLDSVPLSHGDVIGIGRLVSEYGLRPAVHFRFVVAHGTSPATTLPDAQSCAAPDTSADAAAAPRSEWLPLPPPPPAVSGRKGTAVGPAPWQDADEGLSNAYSFHEVAVKWSRGDEPEPPVVGGGGGGESAAGVMKPVRAPAFADVRQEEPVAHSTEYFLISTGDQEDAAQAQQEDDAGRAQQEEFFFICTSASGVVADNIPAWQEQVVVVRLPIPFPGGSSTGVLRVGQSLQEPHFWEVLVPDTQLRAGVSLEHFEVYVDSAPMAGGAGILMNLSEYGTLVNGQLVYETCRLRRGDVVGVPDPVRASCDGAPAVVEFRLHRGSVADSGCDPGLEQEQPSPVGAGASTDEVGSSADQPHQASEPEPQPDWVPDLKAVRGACGGSRRACPGGGRGVAPEVSLTALSPPFMLKCTQSRGLLGRELERLPRDVRMLEPRQFWARLRVGRALQPPNFWQSLLPREDLRNTVSREHFELALIGSELRLSNLSGFGTIVNDRLVRESVAVCDGDTIGIRATHWRDSIPTLVFRLTVAGGLAASTVFSLPFPRPLGQCGQALRTSCAQALPASRAADAEAANRQCKCFHGGPTPCPSCAGSAASQSVSFDISADTARTPAGDRGSSGSFVHLHQPRPKNFTDAGVALFSDDTPASPGLSCGKLRAATRGAGA